MSEHPTPTHHPPDELVVAHAAGQLDVGRRVMVEAHLDFCPSCREAFAELVEPGRRWLEDQPVIAPRPALLEKLLARIDDEATSADGDDLAALGTDLPLPRAARLELEASGHRPRWRSLPLSTARFAILHYDRDSETVLTLARVPGGSRFPRHQHIGCEDVMVLQGAFRDPAGHFRPGDYQLNEPGTEHAPDIDPGERCWIVARYEKGIQFFGLRGLVQRLGRS